MWAFPDWPVRASVSAFAMDDHGRAFDGTIEALEHFVAAHRQCGHLEGDATAVTALGYYLWVSCSCGALFERWVTPEAAEYDLLRSRLSAFEN